MLYKKLLFSFPLSVFPSLSLVKAQSFLGLLGAGVPPLLGALTPFAYWGALLLFSFPFSAFRFPLLVTRCKPNN